MSQEQLCKWCQRPSERLNGRRFYCRPRCFSDARKAYFQRLDARPDRQEMHRRSARAYHQRGGVRRRDRGEYRSREDVRQRHKLLEHAWAEARERNIGVRDVLAEWKAPVGQAGKMDNARRVER